MKKIFFLISVFVLVLTIGGCVSKNIDNVSNSKDLTIIKENELPIDIKNWFDSQGNKKGAYIYQHPNNTYIKVVSGEDKKVIVKNFTDEDYTKTIEVEFLNKKDKNNGLILKLNSNFISNYKIKTINEELPIKEKVVLGVINVPKSGEVISNPARVSGKVAAFEGSFILRVIDENNKILKQEYLQTSGAPQWGEFDTTVAYTPAQTQNGRIEIGEYSAKDGSYIKHAETNIKFN